VRLAEFGIRREGEQELGAVLAVGLRWMGWAPLLKPAHQASPSIYRGRHHTGLVWSIAWRYRFLADVGNGCDIDDLFQEGMFGLMRAAETYDPERGAFSTYAYQWIRQHVTRAASDKARVVRIPVHKLDSMRRCGERPRGAVSLDAPLGDDSEMTRLDRLSADTEPDSDYCPRLDRQRIAALLDSLPERDRDILRGRFWRNETLLEVGEPWGITRERARQLQNQALQTLRARLTPDLELTADHS
jgi:RNA polymerase primary sigma factor